MRRERVCTAWMPASPLVDVHRVQQRLVEAGLVLLGHEEHVVVRRGEALRQFLLADAVVHLLFGVGDARQPVVLHRARERHQRADGVALPADVAVEALLVADRFEAGTGDHHRLGAPARSGGG